jgi:hypothetical protein
MFAGSGLAADLARALYSEPQAPNGTTTVPGAVSVRNGGHLTPFEIVTATRDTGVVVDRLVDGGMCQSEQCRPVHAVIGDGMAAQDGAKRLFDALTRAQEVVTEAQRTRTTNASTVSCTETTNAGATRYECTIGRVHSLSPSDGPVFSVPICGLIACRTTSLSTEMGVLEDLATAIDPAYVSGLDIEIPETISGKWHKGFETITTVGGVALRDPDVMAQPKTQVSATFGGTWSGSGPKTDGFAAAETLYEKMVLARETHSPFSHSTVRTSPNGRVVCAKIVGETSSYYSCQLTDIHQFSSSTVCPNEP